MYIIVLDLQDIDPASVEPWKTTRVTLLGDAIHAMSPVEGLGTSLAFQDADFLAKSLKNWNELGYMCIREYEVEMRIRTSTCINNSRKMSELRHQIIKNNFELFKRNLSMKLKNITWNVKQMTVSYKIF